MGDGCALQNQALPGKVHLISSKLPFFFFFLFLSFFLLLIYLLFAGLGSWGRRSETTKGKDHVERDETGDDGFRPRHSTRALRHGQQEEHNLHGQLCAADLCHHPGRAAVLHALLHPQPRGRGRLAGSVVAGFLCGPGRL